MLAGSIKLVVRAGAVTTPSMLLRRRGADLRFNCPGKNSIAVAELAFALILALDRRVADNVIALRRGEWNKKEFSKLRTVWPHAGLIGVGKIGQEMIPRAQAFGCRDCLEFLVVAAYYV